MASLTRDNQYSQNKVKYRNDFIIERFRIIANTNRMTENEKKIIANYLSNIIKQGISMEQIFDSISIAFEYSNIKVILKEDDFSELKIIAKNEGLLSMIEKVMYIVSKKNPRSSRVRTSERKKKKTNLKDKKDINTTIDEQFTQNVIYLHHLDGFEFEKLVGEIYRFKGYSVVDVKSTGDAGRDLILEKNKKRILIECKHQKGTIGRPVIQKLHSAVVVDQKADQGIVITTGRFSKQARNYIKKLDIPIKLVELPDLRKMAAEIGIRLLLKGEKIKKGFYPVSKEENLFNNIISWLKPKFTSYPMSLEEIFIPSNWHVNFIPGYRVNYRIDHTTKNTTGFVLYDLHETGVIHFRGDNMNKIGNSINTFFSEARPTVSTNQIRVKKAYKPAFLYDETRISKKSKEYLISKYKKYVNYVGGNNVMYTKLCVPKIKDIFIKSIIPVYIPIQKLKLLTLKNKYELELFENNSSKIMIKKSNLNNCLICKEDLGDSGIICNSCGNIAHRPKWWRRSSHSYECDDCGKIICRDCGFWRRKWLFMKHVICEKCYQEEINNGKKLEKIPPIIVRK